MVRQWQELLHENVTSWLKSPILSSSLKPLALWHLMRDPKDLDDAIMEMLNYDGPVIFDWLRDTKTVSQ